MAAGRPPAPGVIDAAPPDLDSVQLPYELYDDTDLARRSDSPMNFPGSEKARPPSVEDGSAASSRNNFV